MQSSQRRVQTVQSSQCRAQTVQIAQTAQTAQTFLPSRPGPGSSPAQRSSEALLAEAQGVPGQPGSRCQGEDPGGLAALPVELRRLRGAVWLRLPGVAGSLGDFQGQADLLSSLSSLSSRGSLYIAQQSEQSGAALPDRVRAARAESQSRVEQSQSRVSAALPSPDIKALAGLIT